MDMKFFWLHDKSTEQNNSIHIGNAADTTYETIQQKTTQLNIIELFAPHM